MYLPGGCESQECIFENNQESMWKVIRPKLLFFKGSNLLYKLGNPFYSCRNKQNRVGKVMMLVNV